MPAALSFDIDNDHSYRHECVLFEQRRVAHALAKVVYVGSWWARCFDAFVLPAILDADFDLEADLDLDAESIPNGTHSFEARPQGSSTSKSSSSSPIGPRAHCRHNECGGKRSCLRCGPMRRCTAKLRASAGPAHSTRRNLVGKTEAFPPVCAVLALWEMAQLDTFTAAQRGRWRAHLSSLYALLAAGPEQYKSVVHRHPSATILPPTPSVPADLASRQTPCRKSPLERPRRLPSPTKSFCSRVVRAEVPAAWRGLPGGQLRDGRIGCRCVPMNFVVTMQYRRVANPDSCVRASRSGPRSGRGSGTHPSDLHRQRVPSSTSPSSDGPSAVPAESA
jgi:hypothetical protein